jgi:succinate dehydrogenase/fumarate reductase flavoprotein subunit
VDHQSRNRPLKLTELEEELKKTLEGCAGPVRHLKSLEESLNRIYNLKGVLAGFASPKGSDWWSLIAFKHQVTVAEIILRSAIKREESRGAHFRSDFPDQDDDRWKLNILVQQDQDGGIRLSTRAL